MFLWSARSKTGVLKPTETCLNKNYLKDFQNHFHYFRIQINKELKLNKLVKYNVVKK